MDAAGEGVVRIGGGGGGGFLPVEDVAEVTMAVVLFLSGSFGGIGLPPLALKNSCRSRMGLTCSKLES